MQAAGTRAVGRRGRTWPQRLVLTAGCVSVTFCLLAAGGLGWFYWRFNQIPTLTFGEGTLAEDPGGPQNFLLVGSDSAAGLGETDPETVGRGGVSGQRADTIIILRIEPKSKKAALLSIPRDTYVPIAGTGRSAKINEAFRDGPEPLIRTITEAFRIPIHHYVQVDFAGFKGLVNAVGGVDVYFTSPARDERTGLRVDAPGCHRFDGTGALAYVRSRHYQYLEGTRWITDPRADLSRIDRQQDFIRRAVAKVLSKRLNPLTLNRLGRVGAKYVQRDKALGLDEILALGDRFRSVDPASLETYELPTVASADLGHQEVVKEPAELVLARFRPKPSAGRAVVPSGVRVRVLNGTGVPGQATSVRDALAAIGFVVAQPGDAPPYGRERTEIRFGNGQEKAAVLLARHLGSSAVLVSDPAIVGADVILTTGNDFTTVTQNLGPPPTTPPSTAPPAAGAPPPTTLPQNAPPGPPC